MRRPVLLVARSVRGLVPTSRPARIGSAVVGVALSAALFLVAGVPREASAAPPAETPPAEAPGPAPPPPVPDTVVVLGPWPVPHVDLLPTDRSTPLTAVQVQRLMVDAGFPPDEIGTGVAITLAESSRIPDNTNVAGNHAGTDRGLWQINDHYWGEELARIDWRDPVQNTRLALAIDERSGWGAWTTYKPASMDDRPPPDPDALVTRTVVAPARTGT